MNGMYVDKLFHGHANVVLDTFPEKIANCVVTSPPYYGLRDYEEKDQLGLEDTPEEYIKNMVEVFRKVSRVLKDDGTLWVNIGDSYFGSRKGGNQAKYKNFESVRAKIKWNHDEIKPKDMIGIPWMLAFALRADGWYLRQDIIWNKPNPMPESVTDRCTKSHEYIFLLSKSAKYYFDADAIKTKVADATVQRMMQQIEDQKGSNRVPYKTNGAMKAVGPGRKPAPHDNRGGNQGSTTGIKAYSHRGTGDKKLTGHSGNFDINGNLIGDGMANKKSVWTVTTKPFREAHFATYPQELIIDCIKAGCPEGGLVLDPFMGAGTTAVVAKKLNRHYIGIDLNRRYINEIAEPRIRKVTGLFSI